MYKKEENKKPHVIIGTIGHVDTPKSTLIEAIKNYITTNNDKAPTNEFEGITINDKAPTNEFEGITINKPIIKSVEALDKVELDRKRVIEEGKKYIKPETIELWEEFAHEYACFCSGLFLSKLVEILKRLNAGMSLDEMEEYIERSMLTKKLINYICIALIRFSDYGFKFYERFYKIDVPVDSATVVNEEETAMCRMLTKKENK